jgi:hypothetical protein
MVYIYFHTKNLNWSLFWSDLAWKNVGFFKKNKLPPYTLTGFDLTNKLQSPPLQAIPLDHGLGQEWKNVGTFHGNWEYLRVSWYILCPFGVFVVIWYILSRFVILYQEKSGKPAFLAFE